jgi:hypothetical protein
VFLGAGYGLLKNSHVRVARFIALEAGRATGSTLLAMADQRPVLRHNHLD